MSLSTEVLFTAALGLQAPWQVNQVELSTANKRIDFSVGCSAKRLSCPHCGGADQGIHDRVSKSWRHLDFFQYEAWLHADVPRVACTACGKTTLVPVPWAREGSGPRWPVQIPPPVATPNSPRQDESDYDDSGLMAMRAAASLSR